MAEKSDRPEHGTVGRYRNYGCHCQKCRAANAEAQRAWREKVREKAS